MPRTRFRRRRRGGRGRGRSFKRLARRIAHAGAEPKYMEISASFASSPANGDGTSRVLRIQNLPSNLIQGTGEDQFVGNSVWLKGVGIRLNVSNLAAGFDTTYIRFTLFFSRSNALAMTGNGALMGNATRADVAPAQTAGFSNPRIFDIVGVGPGPFVSTSSTTPFDRTNVKIIGTKMIRVNSGGSSVGMVIKKWFWPIKRQFQFQNPDNSALTVAPNHGKFGSYYMIIQSYGPLATAAQNISATVIQELQYTCRLYFRDP